MPVVNGTVDNREPVVDLLVGVGEERRQILQRHGFPVPKRVRVLAQVDTGSALTVIDGSLLRLLDLKPVGEKLIFTPSTGLTPHRAEEYSVSIALAHSEIEAYFPVVLAIGVLFAPSDGVQALLGRDCLELCRFFYNGSAGTFSLAF